MQMTAMPRNQSITEEQIQMIKSALESIQSSKLDYITALEEELKQRTKSVNKKNARDLEARRVQAAKRPGLLQRMGERIVNAYAVAFAAFVLWGEALGLWIIEED